jgi:hypothetical protein
MRICLDAGNVLQLRNFRSCGHFQPALLTPRTNQLRNFLSCRQVGTAWRRCLNWRISPLARKVGTAWQPGINWRISPPARKVGTAWRPGLNWRISPPARAGLASAAGGQLRNLLSCGRGRGSSLGMRWHALTPKAAWAAEAGGHGPPEKGPRPRPRAGRLFCRDGCGRVLRILDVAEALREPARAICREETILKRS